VGGGASQGRGERGRERERGREEKRKKEKTGEKTKKRGRWLPAVSRIATEGGDHVARVRHHSHHVLCSGFRVEG